MSDEEFDEESFVAYENELYEEQLKDSDDEIESDVEEALYGQVHYSFSLSIEEEVDDEQDGVKASPAVVVISDDDDDNGVDNKADDKSQDCLIDVDANDGDDPNTPEESHENWDLIEKDLEDETPGRVKRAVSRYYKATTKNPHMRCYNCNEKGHLVVDCPEPKKVITCVLCGIPGHIRHRCPNSLCFNCSEPGHRSYQCKQRFRARRTDQCRRCFQNGHHSYGCPDLWRQYHRTVVVGVTPVPDRTKEFTGPAYCCNCSAKGHYGHECIEERPDDRTCAFQFIVRYDGECSSRKRSHERQDDYIVQERGKKYRRKDQQQTQHNDRRKSWPSQREPGNNDGDLTPITEIVRKRKKHKKNQPSARKKKNAENTTRNDNNEDLVMRLNERHSERTVELRPDTDYYDHAGSQHRDSTTRTVEFNHTKDRRLSDTLMRIVDDWEEINEKRESGKRNKALSKPDFTHQKRNSLPGSSRKDRYSSPGFSHHDDRLFPGSAYEDDRSSPGTSHQDHRSLPGTSYQDDRSSPGTSYQDHRSLPGTSYQDDRSSPGTSYQDHRSLPGPESRVQNNDYRSKKSRKKHSRSFQDSTRNDNRSLPDSTHQTDNRKWPKKNKSHNQGRGFRSAKKNKNFTL